MEGDSRHPFFYFELPAIFVKFTHKKFQQRIKQVASAAQKKWLENVLSILTWVGRKNEKSAKNIVSILRGRPLCQNRRTC